MNRTIFKYQFSIVDRFSISMPRGAKIVLVECQGEYPTIWALVTDIACKEDRHFAVFGTGHPIPPECEHVGSFQAPPYVWHLFEVKK